MLLIKSAWYVISSGLRSLTPIETGMCTYTHDVHYADHISAILENWLYMTFKQQIHQPSTHTSNSDTQAIFYSKYVTISVVKLAPIFFVSVLCFCFVLFCFVLFCFVLFCFVLFCFVLFCFVLFCVLLVRISVVKDIQQGTYMRSLHALVSSSATYGYHTALYMCFNVVSLQLPFLFIPATCTSSNEYLHVTQRKALSTCPNQCMQPVLLTFTTIAQTTFMNTIWEVPILTV